MKILSVVGARPQFIKEAQMQKIFRNHSEIKKILVHTGQHFDKNMSGIFFNYLEIDYPDYNLNVKNLSHGKMTAEMIKKLEDIFIFEKPDYIIVYGDTNSTLSAAIAASKLNIKLVHIEAGLRQKPKNMPEEINRVITDRISDILFAPSDIAVKNLKSENIINGVHNVGDIMYDILLNMKSKFKTELIHELKLLQGEYIVFTLHRDFNVDDKEILIRILTNVFEISKNNQIFFPIHPRTFKNINRFGLNKYLENVITYEPIDYLSLMGIVTNCKYVITDSGGLQKEAYFLGKKSIVLMEDTAWIELINQGINKLVNPKNSMKPDDLLINIHTEKEIFQNEIYGNGFASKKIVDLLIEDFKKESNLNDY